MGEGGSKIGQKSVTYYLNGPKQKQLDKLQGSWAQHFVTTGTNPTKLFLLV